VPADLLPRKLMSRAKQCARFLRRWLPEHFPAKGDLVLVNGHVLVDITLRMLQPEELKLAQGFRADYILDRGLFYNPKTGQDEWRKITKTDQVRLIGNSVCRQVAAALVRANAADLIALYQRMAA
jgi:DNA (cytosine-5)-methyltransferase 1